MFKILLALLLMTTSAWSAQWRAGTGENSLLGSSNAADIDTNTFNSIVNPLDNLLANYREGLNINYSSSSQLTISAGSVTVSNSDGSVRLMLKNSGSTTIDFTNIDTGVEASTTTYYIYAVAASTSSTSATFKISLSNTAPSGSTYYKRLGYFLNDGSSNITDIHNDNLFHESGTWSSKSTGVTYQALTDGVFQGGFTSPGSSGTNPSVGLYTDSSSSPTTIRAYCSADKSTFVSTSCTTFVKKGDYYKSGSGLDFLFFIPVGQ